MRMRRKGHVQETLWKEDWELTGEGKEFGGERVEEDSKVYTAPSNGEKRCLDMS